MPTIQRLPHSLINKIAAGEVIERPASVVKELLENCIDAGATRIELTLEQGGLELIRITDDGCGIATDQLPLAIAPHATSKLQSADDLFDVRTLGFRGEALASIAEISHLVIRSRTVEQMEGSELIVRGGECEPIRPCAAPVGTTMEVRHLFFNTPVRRKFLKSSATETSHITEAFTRMALAYPTIHWRLASSGRNLFDLPQSQRWSERIRVFFGDEVADSLIPIDHQEGEFHWRGYVCDPSVSRSNNRLQYLFLNGRPIRDRSLQHALSEAYRGLLMVGRFPCCFLRLQMPATEVDVNVHPTKAEVRFLDGGKLYSQLLHAIRQKFLSSDLTARGSASQESSSDPMGVPTGQTGPSAGQMEPASGNRSALWSHPAAPPQSGAFPAASGAQVHLPSAPPAPAPPTPGFWTSPTWPSSQATGGHPNPAPPFRPFPDPFPQAHTAPATDTQSPSRISTIPLPGNAIPWSPDVVAGESEASHHAPSIRPRGFQIHHRYIVTQDDRGMVVIDQHALHERILYQQLRARVDSGRLDRQKLLVPLPVTLTAAEATLACESKELLAEVGLEIESIGSQTVLVSAYPAMLTRVSPAEALRLALEPLVSGGRAPSPRDLLDAMLHQWACKAAIKAGDPLTEEEISDLLAQQHAYQDTHHCPHGRPTALVFSCDQIDRMFKRT
jgi:DNA mismatch repair protein MutL